MTPMMWPRCPRRTRQPKTREVASGGYRQIVAQLPGKPLVTTPIAEVTQARELLVRAHAEFA